MLAQPILSIHPLPTDKRPSSSLFSSKITAFPFHSQPSPHSGNFYD
jgi:hypothetical protein